MATIQAVIADFDIMLADHDPYAYGGISFYTGADCSGWLYEALVKQGVIDPARTSQDQFAQWKPAPGPGYGIAVFFDVPQDGPPQPQHVALCLGNGTMAEEPHTGLDAEIVPIPNIPGVESIMGYRYLPVSYGAPATTAPTTAPSPPIPTAPLEDAMQMYAEDPKTGGGWGTDENGDNYPYGTAPLIPGLNDHPDYKAGGAESGDTNPCVGIAYWAFGLNDGILLFTKPSNGQGTWGGTVSAGQCPYDIYRFLRNGTPA